MERSRKAHQETQDARCPSKTLGIISARKARRSSLITTVSTATVQDQELCGISQNLFLCHKQFLFLFALSAILEINLTPGKAVSLQCVLLEQGHSGEQQVSLTWVDETGAEVQQDSYQQLTRDSACDTTLTVSVQSPGLKKFKCQMTVNQKFSTAVALRLRVSGLWG